jgi:hypothetical protein
LSHVTQPLGELIDALADIIVEDYLRETAANDAAPAHDRENHVLPAARDAA